MIEPIQDYYTIEVECRYEEKKTKSGIILINTAWIDDRDMDRNEHKRRYGKLLSIPPMFSDNAFRAIDDGMPAYHKYVGHDDIVDRMNRGYRNHSDKAYYPSTFERYDTVTMSDLSKLMDMHVGDTVYFMPQVTEDENMLLKEKGREVYQLCVTDVICVVRDGRIITQGEWVLIKPKIETWEEITSPAGVITKSAPEKKWLLGTVAHSHYDHCKIGDEIVYLPNADAPIKVEGEEFYVMPVQDVIGKLN